METCEFSETQFVIGYLREILNAKFYAFPYFHWITPSTRMERATASDFIIKNFNGKYRFSEYYQFKRSHLFNKEVFNEINSTRSIDTSLRNYLGFSIYNKSSTQQFNTLQKIAKRSRSKAYYCAPNFHTISEFRNYFGKNTITDNSKLFDFSQPIMQTVNIALNSNHKIIFDGNLSYICSDINEIKNINASERQKYEINSDINSLKEEIDFASSIINENEKNIIDIKQTLFINTGIIWITYFDEFIV
ncbi:hypothetical protein AB3N60_11360 [Leptospira sp. WS39.C2]